MVHTGQSITGRRESEPAFFLYDIDRTFFTLHIIPCNILPQNCDKKHLNTAQEEQQTDYQSKPGQAVPDYQCNDSQDKSGGNQKKSAVLP